MLQCEDEQARQWEQTLRRRLWRAEVLKDNVVITADFNVPWIHETSRCGIPVRRHGDTARGGSYKAECMIEDYEEAFKILHTPYVTVDYERSNLLMEQAQEVFENILNVRRHQRWWWSLGLCWDFIDLRGYENFLCDMIDEPENFHRMMRFL